VGGLENFKIHDEQPTSTYGALTVRMAAENIPIPKVSMWAKSKLLKSQCDDTRQTTAPKPERWGNAGVANQTQ